jgi:GDP-4-dehydro-6-deoxy-D-mannose reductase
VPEKRTVLVTGANGFVGPHLVRALAASGARVRGCGVGDPPAGAPLDSWHPFDLFDPASAQAAIGAARPDAVVHLAGQASAAVSFRDPEGTFRANATGAWHVAEAVRRQAPSARLLLVSTSEVYGPRPAGSRVAEDAPFAPVSPYAMSKAAAETLVGSHARVHGLDLVVARAFGHIGPGQSPRFVVPGWAEQIAAIEAGRAEPVLRVGNLEVTRDLSDVRDIVSAYVALLDRGARLGVYNVCRGEGIALADLLARLVARARVPVRVETDPDRLRPADLPWLVGDPSALTSLTGWSASIPLDRALDDVLDEWRARAQAR